MKILTLLLVGVSLTAPSLAPPAWAQDTSPASAALSDAPVPNAALTMPKWSEFPVPPTDVPTLSDVAGRVAEQAKISNALADETAALKWDGTLPEPFTREALSRLDPGMMKPVDKPMSVQAIEALGAELRRRAVPPPVAN